MIQRVAAGTNERFFQTLMQQKAPEIRLLGKRRFVVGDVEISVDQSFEYNGTEYLIEIDSANMAKLLVGQYVLLNQLHTNREKTPFFLVVHAYKKYNPQRTLHNLRMVNEQLYDGAGIEFGAVHLTGLSNWKVGFKEFLTFVGRA
jgi:lipopolysaccharide biosynthesis protein